MTRMYHPNRDMVKIKSLLFLRMSRQAGLPYRKARDISKAINGNTDSLYILLTRWCRWKYIYGLLSTPRAYAIAKEGRRYLDKLPEWHPADITEISMEIAGVSLFSN